MTRTATQPRPTDAGAHRRGQLLIGIAIAASHGRFDLLTAALTVVGAAFV